MYWFLCSQFLRRRSVPRASNVGHRSAHPSLQRQLSGQCRLQRSVCSSARLPHVAWRAQSSRVLPLRKQYAQRPAGTGESVRVE